MARYINHAVSHDGCSEDYIETIIDKMNTLINLATFHMSSNWQMLFSQAAIYLSMITVDKSSYTTTPEELFKRMHKTIKQLEREPRNHEFTMC